MPKKIDYGEFNKPMREYLAEGNRVRTEKYLAVLKKLQEAEDKIEDLEHDRRHRGD